MTEAAVEAAEPDEVLDPAAPPAADAPPAGDPPPADPDADNAEDIAEAKTMGWKEPANFKGGADKALSAKEFVRRGREILPFVQKENKTLKKEIDQLKGSLGKFSEFHDKTEARLRDQILREFRAEHAQAVEAGDVAAADDVLERMSDFKAEVKTAPKPAEGQVDRAPFEAWIGDNAWFNTSSTLKAAAIQIAEEIKADYPEPAQQLAEVSKRIKAEFPEKFAPPSNPRRAAPGAVEGAPAAGQRQSGHTFSDLPADAKKMCDDLVRDIPGFTREKYVKGFDFKGYQQ